MAPSVVIGILHHHKVLEWRTLSREKRTVLEYIPDVWKKG